MMEKKLNLLKALSGFQQECPVIHKGTKGYGYTYSSLPEIFEVINPLLKKYKLGFTQLLNQDNLTTIVFHTESGEYIQSETQLKTDVELSGMNYYQVMGSATTYLRRYSLSAILGIVTDKDNDAQGEKKQTQQPQKKTQATTTTSKKTPPKEKLTDEKYILALEFKAKDIKTTLRVFDLLPKQKEGLENALKALEAPKQKEETEEIKKEDDDNLEALPRLTKGSKEWDTMVGYIEDGSLTKVSQLEKKFSISKALKVEISSMIIKKADGGKDEGKKEIPDRKPAIPAKVFKDALKMEALDVAVVLEKYRMSGDQRTELEAIT